MQIGNKLFPYPTINKFKTVNCFKETSYSFKYEECEDDKHIYFKNIHVEINNIEIVNLMNQGKLEALLIVECSSTVYREKFAITLEPIDIIISLDNLRDTVVVSSFIYAKEDIEEYRNSDFLDDYEEIKFHIEKYDIIAIDDGFTTKVDYDENADRKVSSIFSIIKNSEMEEKIMKIKEGAKKIIIELPEEQFNIYDNMKANDNFNNIFFSIIAIPSLIKCLQKLQNEATDIDEIKLQYGWFESIDNGFKKLYGENITIEKFKELDIANLSQKLLNCASVNAIGDFFGFVAKKNIERSDDDE